MKHNNSNIRAAIPADAAAICEVYLLSRKHFLPYAPLAHNAAEVCIWIEQHLITTADVFVVEQDGSITGMMALTRDASAGWIDQLYLHPRVVGQRIGSQLVSLAKNKLGAPVRLYTFQANTAARRFYERHAFVAILFGDGSGNEEKCPDVLYEWKAEVI